MPKAGSAIVLTMLLAILWMPSGAAAEGEEHKAAAAAGSFTALLDAQQCAAAWEQFTPLARVIKAQEQWQSQHRALRSAYGPLEKRTLRGVTLQNRYPMIPDGRIAIVQFDTAFASKRGAIETVVLVLAAGERWLVHDYVIN